MQPRRLLGSFAASYTISAPQTLDIGTRAGVKGGTVTELVEKMIVAQQAWNVEGGAVRVGWERAPTENEQQLCCIDCIVGLYRRRSRGSQQRAARRDQGDDAHLICSGSAGTGCSQTVDEEEQRRQSYSSTFAMPPFVIWSLGRLL